MENQVFIKEEPAWEESDGDAAGDGGELQPPLEVYVKTEFCEEPEPEEKPADPPVTNYMEGPCCWLPQQLSAFKNFDISLVKPSTLVHSPEADPLRAQNAPPGSYVQIFGGAAPGCTDGTEMKVVVWPDPAEKPKVQDSGDVNNSTPCTQHGGRSLSNVGVVYQHEQATNVTANSAAESSLTQGKIKRTKRVLKEGAGTTVSPAVGKKPKRRLICPICQKVSSSSSHLIRHVRIHYKVKTPRPPVPVKRYKCDYCGKFLSTSSNRLQHMRIHIPNKEPPKEYVCDFCSKVYITKQGWRQHVRRHHTAVPSNEPRKEYPCEVCSKVYTSKSGWRNHMRRHAGKRYRYPTKSSKCEVCGKELSSTSNRKRHMLTHCDVRPEKPKPVECKVCGKELSSNSTRRQHMLVHKGTKPFKCPDCDAAFLRKEDVKRHSRIHTGDRPYVCHECGKGFIQSAHLTGHMRMHRGERPFMCDMCPSSFAQSSQLKRHKTALHVEEMVH